YEDIAKHNDSILSLVAMNDAERTTFFEKYIEKLKKEDELKAKLAAEKAEKEANKQINPNNDLTGSKFNPNPNAIKSSSMMPPSGLDNQSTFYFYNPVTVSYGVKEFQKKWGTRKHDGNWRQSKAKEDFLSNDVEEKI